MQQTPSHKMVLLVNSDYYIQPQSSSQTTSSSSSSPMMTAATGDPSSSLSSSTCDEEGGYSSQEEIISSKFTPTRNGKFTRRRSQCKQQSLRQRSSFVDAVDDDGSSQSQQKQQRSGGRIAAAPTSQPMNLHSFRQQLTSAATILTSNNNDLPKTVQFYPPGSDQQHCPTSSSSPSSFKKSLHQAKNFPYLALIALFTIISLLQQFQLSSLQEELLITNQHRSYQERTHSNILAQLNHREGALNQYRSANTHMAEMTTNLENIIENLKAKVASQEVEIERLLGVEKRVGHSEGRWDEVVARVQERSLVSVVDKYGEGPYQVELQVQLREDEETTVEETIKIDMAPLDMMPHSVHTFLEQVDQGVWDGTAFGVHAGHVLMAHTTATTKNDRQDQAAKAAVPTVMFPEFNADYPHDKYTIAFPAPSSSSSTSAAPDFYINLQSNVAHHSPRIETSDTDTTKDEDDDGSEEEKYIEGEPCFGKITDEESRRVVDKMDGLSVALEGASGIVIKSAKIVGK